MNQVTRDTFSAEINAGVATALPEMKIPPFTLEQGQQAWDKVETQKIDPDEAVRTIVENMVEHFGELPDMGSG